MYLYCAKYTIELALIPRTYRVCLLVDSDTTRHENESSELHSEIKQITETKLYGRLPVVLRRVRSKDTSLPVRELIASRIECVSYLRIGVESKRGSSWALSSRANGVCFLSCGSNFLSF